MLNIVEKVTLYQTKHNLTNRSMAKVLCISESAWSRLRGGSREPSEAFWGGVLVGLPEFTTDVIIALKEKITNNNTSEGKPPSGLALSDGDNGGGAATKKATRHKNYTTPQSRLKRSNHNITSANTKGQVI